MEITADGCERSGASNSVDWLEAVCLFLREEAHSHVSVFRIFSIVFFGLSRRIEKKTPRVPVAVFDEFRQAADTKDITFRRLRESKFEMRIVALFSRDGTPLPPSYQKKEFIFSHPFLGIKMNKPLVFLITA